MNTCSHLHIVLAFNAWHRGCVSLTSRCHAAGYGETRVYADGFSSFVPALNVRCCARDYVTGRARCSAKLARCEARA